MNSVEQKVVEILKLEKIKNKYFAFVDLETSGFVRHGADVLTTSIIITDYELDIKDKKTFFSRPRGKTYWSESAEKVHGIGYQAALEFDEPRRSCIEILHFLKPFKHPDNYPITFVSHDNNNFDYFFFIDHFRREDLHWSTNKVFDDDHRLSTVKLGRKAGYEKNKLNIWADRLKIELDHHNSESDALACYEVFKHLMTKELVL